MENNSDSVLLLKECDAALKMAVENLDQIRAYTKDSNLREFIDKYYDAHVKLKIKCRDALDVRNAQGKSPNPIAKASSTVQTKVKIAMDDSSSQIAKLLTDGCNMGIENLSKYINEHKDADKDSLAIATDLRSLEEKMAGDLQPLL